MRMLIQKRQCCLFLSRQNKGILLKQDRKSAARYAQSLGLDSVTMAVFIPIVDEDVLQELSAIEKIQGVEVAVVAIGWT